MHTTVTADQVLVTGADGFIGSHLVEALVRRGARVRAMVLYDARGQRGWLDTLPAHVLDAIEVVASDVRDPFATRAAMERCRAVLHLAALIGIPYSYVAPASYVATNVSGTLNILEAARSLGTERVVITSTSEVYGTARYVPIDEAHPLTAQSPYAASKIAADQLALSYHRAFELPVMVVRPFNTYGPRQSARAVIPTIITQLARGQRKIQLGSLSPTRDFSFVEDIAAGFVAALESEIVGEVIQLGSGFEISIGDTARMIAQAMGVEVRIEQDPQRVRPAQSEVERLFCDPSLARSRLGWSPQHGGPEGFMAGLRKTIAWFTNPRTLGLYRTDEYAI